MDQTLSPAFVLLAVVVMLALCLRDPPSFWRQLRNQLDQLGHELDRHADSDRRVPRLPVFSAQTINGKEAEFLRQRLPRKAPRTRYVLLLLAFGVLVWWLTR